jgi:phosphoenolpyruvate carboxykinase (ATP)
LTEAGEPEIFHAIKFGTVLENVGVDPKTGAVDFFDNEFTENTRAAYPLEYIENVQIPSWQLIRRPLSF